MGRGQKDHPLSLHAPSPLPFEWQQGEIIRNNYVTLEHTFPSGGCISLLSFVLDSAAGKIGPSWIALSQ